VEDETGGLRFAVGMEMEPLIFVGAECDRFIKPAPAYVFRGNAFEDFALFRLIRLCLFNLLEQLEPCSFPEGIALQR